MARVNLSALLSAASGSMGEVTFVLGPGGFVVRKKPTYRYQPGPAQIANSERLKQASAIWNEMTAAQAEAWERYARANPKPGFSGNSPYTPIPRNLFLGLATKILQIDPAAPIPIAPPESDFLGDNVVLTAGGAPGGLVYTASGPNSSNVVMELMIQPLANERRKPTDRYRLAEFWHFEPGSLWHLVPLSPGWYAAAYRQVNRATGQMTGLGLLGKWESSPIL